MTIRGHLVATRSGRLGMLLLLSCSLCAVADSQEDPAVTSMSPSLAGFYLVDSTGESVPDEPTVEIIGNARADSSVTIVGASSGSPGDPEDRQKPVVRIITEIRRPAAEPFAEWRCERFGFYYTKDGRCVAPGLQQGRRRR